MVHILNTNCGYWTLVILFPLRLQRLNGSFGFASFPRKIKNIEMTGSDKMVEWSIITSTIQYGKKSGRQYIQKTKITVKKDIILIRSGLSYCKLPQERTLCSFLVTRIHLLEWTLNFNEILCVFLHPFLFSVILFILIKSLERIKKDNETKTTKLG